MRFLFAKFMYTTYVYTIYLIYKVISLFPPILNSSTNNLPSLPKQSHITCYQYIPFSAKLTRYSNVTAGSVRDCIYIWSSPDSPYHIIQTPESFCVCTDLDFVRATKTPNLECLHFEYSYAGIEPTQISIPSHIWVPGTTVMSSAFVHYMLYLSGKEYLWNHAYTAIIMDTRYDMHTFDETTPPIYLTVAPETLCINIKDT